jgi:hypothetical protein
MNSAWILVLCCFDAVNGGRWDSVVVETRLTFTSLSLLPQDIVPTSEGIWYLQVPASSQTSLNPLQQQPNTYIYLLHLKTHRSSFLSKQDNNIISTSATTSLKECQNIDSSPPKFNLIPNISPISPVLSAFYNGFICRWTSPWVCTNQPSNHDLRYPISLTC